MTVEAEQVPRSLIEIARRALVAQVNHEPVFLTRHERWVIERVLVHDHKVWNDAVLQASARTGITPNKGKPVKVIIVDKLPEPV